jgi:hypothetical protein
VWLSVYRLRRRIESRAVGLFSAFTEDVGGDRISRARFDVEPTIKDGGLQDEESNGAEGGSARNAFRTDRGFLIRQYASFRSAITVI